MAMGRNSRNKQGLPAVIVHEILFCLSVKHLTKLKLVCKSWCSFISDPLFQEEHYSRCSKKDPLFLMKTEVSVFITHYYSAVINKSRLSLVNYFSQSTPTRKPILRERMYPVQSCRGLICFYTLKTNKVFLLNPCTEEMITLPPTEGTNICIGFGYTTSTKEFKVARFYQENSDTKTLCEVFTLGHASWRKARRPPYQVRGGCVPFVHEAIYLKPVLYDQQDGYITAFDIKCEDCSTCIRFPEYYYTTEDNFELEDIDLRELAGSLCLTFGIGKIKRHLAHMKVWLLNDRNNGQWVQGYDVDFSSLTKLLHSSVPIVILGDGTLLIDVYTEQEKMLFLYDPKIKILTPRFRNIWSAVPYVESFFRLSM